MNKFSFTIFLFLLSLIFSPILLSKDKTSTIELEKQNVMLILDVSQSMWGQIDGQTKIILHATHFKPMEQIH